MGDRSAVEEAPEYSAAGLPNSKEELPDFDVYGDGVSGLSRRVARDRGPLQE